MLCLAAKVQSNEISYSSKNKENSSINLLDNKSHHTATAGKLARRLSICAFSFPQ